MNLLDYRLAIFYPGWWFQLFFIFTPIWGRFTIWLIFFRWVETTNQYRLYHHFPRSYIAKSWNLPQKYLIMVHTHLQIHHPKGRGTPLSTLLTRVGHTLSCAATQDQRRGAYSVEKNSQMMRVWSYGEQWWYPPWNKHSTWKWAPENGRFKRPIFRGDMWVSGRVMDIWRWIQILS